MVHNRMDEVKTRRWKMWGRKLVGHPVMQKITVLEMSPYIAHAHHV